MARFPDIAALASAEEDDVLRHWEGLGYYRRARSLHAAARRIMEHHQGEFPESWEDVLRLPGVGRYTAGAILSIARGQRRPILEANTQRLYARLLALRQDPRAAEGQRILWDFAETLLPRRRVGDLNQALMELGALVCLPQAPQCLLCPVAAHCRARREGLQSLLPLAPPKKQYEEVTEVALVVLRHRRVMLRQCGPQERWAGLWDFPRFRLPAAESACSPAGRAAVRAAARELIGAELDVGERLTVMRHAVTRFKIRLECHYGLLAAGTKVPAVRWIKIADLGDLALNTTGRRLARRLQRDSLDDAGV